MNYIRYDGEVTARELRDFIQNGVSLMLRMERDETVRIRVEVSEGTPDQMFIQLGGGLLDPVFLFRNVSTRRADDDPCDGT